MVMWKCLLCDNERYVKGLCEDCYHKENEDMVAQYESRRGE